MTDTQRADAERHATAELTEQCDQFEDDLDELRARYELYFLGVERLEPVRRREDMKRRIARMKTAFTRNAGVRFRIETLHARYLAYERMWVRAARQREEGTYHRDIFKARRRGATRVGPTRPGARKPGEASEDVDLSDWDGEVEEAAPQAEPTQAAAPPEPPAVRREAPPPAAAPRPAPAPTPPASRAPAGGLSDDQMRSLYDAYLSAKKRCNEDVSKLSYDSVSRSVSKQIPEIIQRYKAGAVDFKVVIKDGKAILKATPKPPSKP
jgi:hypothetical protein